MHTYKLLKTLFPINLNIDESQYNVEILVEIKFNFRLTLNRKLEFWMTKVNEQEQWYNVLVVVAWTTWPNSILKEYA